MKTAISILLFWAVASSFATEPVGKPATHGTSELANPYELVRQENNISIYSRWIQVDEERSARQVKVTFVVNAPAEQALSVLTNDSSFTSWMGGTRDYRRVHTIDSGNWYSYIQFSIPWPLKDQDCIIHYEVRVNSDHYKEILLHGEPDYLAAVDGVTRICHMEGTWKLVSAGPNRTLIEYIIFSRQASSFPRWITDPIIQNNMIRTMTAFREQVGQEDRRTGGPVKGERRLP